MLDGGNHQVRDILATDAQSAFAIVGVDRSNETAL
jgi:hypothetical protein